MGKYTDRKYIYIRDHQRCTFCGKVLQLGNMSVDHYYPRSKGGTYDVFNLVASCKRCNRWKKNRIPEDWEQRLIQLLEQAVKDKRVTSSIPRMKHSQLMRWLQGIQGIKFVTKYVVAETTEKRFYMKENKVFKIETIKTRHSD